MTIEHFIAVQHSLDIDSGFIENIAREKRVRRSITHGLIAKYDPYSILWVLTHEISSAANEGSSTASGNGK